MRNRAARGVLAVGTVLCLLTVGMPAPAAAVTIYGNNHVCSMYVNSTGFGAYCSGGRHYPGGRIPTWRERLADNQAATNSFGPFIPCRDFPIPQGVELPPPPDGKTWSLRIWIVDYNLDQPSGGSRVHLEREIVPVSEAERNHCREMAYMDMFWNQFHSTYPTPVLIVKPTYTPRVNVPAYFSLTPESSTVLREQAIRYNGFDYIRLRALVVRMRLDPGDGSRPFDCLMGADPIDEDGYDESQDPFHQLSTCKHVYKRSSASQQQGMYSVKMTLTWEVSFWEQNVGWQPIGTAEVNAVQRLPVQEVHAIGG